MRDEGLAKDGQETNNEVYHQGVHNARSRVMAVVDCRVSEPPAGPHVAVHAGQYQPNPPVQSG